MNEQKNTYNQVQKVLIALVNIVTYRFYLHIIIFAPTIELVYILEIAWSLNQQMYVRVDWQQYPIQSKLCGVKMTAFIVILAILHHFLTKTATFSKKNPKIKKF